VLDIALVGVHWLLDTYNHVTHEVDHVRAPSVETRSTTIHSRSSSFIPTSIRINFISKIIPYIPNPRQPRSTLLPQIQTPMRLATPDIPLHPTPPLRPPSPKTTHHNFLSPVHTPSPQTTNPQPRLLDRHRLSRPANLVPHPRLDPPRRHLLRLLPSLPPSQTSTRPHFQSWLRSPFNFR
jgi:hypothetical protein